MIKVYGVRPSRDAMIRRLKRDRLLSDGSFAGIPVIIEQTSHRTGRKYAVRGWAVRLPQPTILEENYRLYVSSENGNVEGWRYAKEICEELYDEEAQR